MGPIDPELARILRKEFPADTSWLGFAKWWLDAKGFEYRGRQDLLVDGSGDGGIDVIARPDAELGRDDIFVIQSKYVKASPRMDALERFLGAIDALNGKPFGFEAWLGSVRPELRRIYRRLREDRRKLRFVLITTAHLKSRFRRKLERFGVEVYERDEISGLLGSYKRGKTPRVGTIRLAADKPIPLLKSPEHRLWCVRISLRSLGRAYDKHGPDLFAGNVRYALKGENPNKVRSGIKQTVLNRPQEFIYFHNGITIVSREISHRAGQLTVKSPSIVNGAQTVNFVGTSLLERIPKNAYVLAKIIEVMPGYSFEQLETDIALSSNTQNKVDFSDLTVADPALVELERGFRRFECFLERKKGSDPGFRPLVRIKKERLVQIYAAVDPRLGSTYAKSPQQLFKRETAKELLRSYAKANHGLEDSICLAKLDSLCRNALEYSNKRRSRRAKTAYFAIFAAYVMAIKDTRRWGAMRKELVHSPNHWETDFLDDVRRDVRQAASLMLKRSAGAHRKNEPAFYKNKTLADEAVHHVSRKLRPVVRNHYWI